MNNSSTARSLSIMHRWPAEARVIWIVALAAMVLNPVAWLTDLVLIGVNGRSLGLLLLRTAAGLAHLPLYLGSRREQPPRWLERTAALGCTATALAGILAPTALRPTSLSAQAGPLVVILLIYAMAFPVWRQQSKTLVLLVISAAYVALGAYWGGRVPGYAAANELITAAVILLAVSLVAPHVSQRIDSVETELVVAKQRLQTTVDELRSEAALRKEREVALDRARDEAETANAAKTEFLATVSHELRTPLTAMAGSLRLLSAMDPDAARREQLLAVCDRNTQRLLDLVNALLDAQSLDAGKFRVFLEPLSIVTVLNEAEHGSPGLTELYRVKFDFAAVTDELWVSGDTVRLQQALNNLLSNASKHSFDGETVSVRALSRSDNECKWVRVEVTDRGAGVPDSFRERVFERFAMAERSAEAFGGGTGLGLSITKALIEAHGGNVGFESTPGKGATFWFELPLLETPPDAHLRSAETSTRIRVC